MRKFLLPIINLVNIILTSIAFSLGTKTAVVEKIAGEVGKGSYYQLVWNAADKANIFGIIGFFLFVGAAVFMLSLFIPVKCRKFTAILTGGLYIAAGVFFLKTPGSANITLIKPQLTGSLIAMAVLVFICGALSLVMAAIDFSKKEAK